jgi:hypothetical protein
LYLAGQRISEELKLLASVTLRIAALLYTLETGAQRDLLLHLANGENTSEQRSSLPRAGAGAGGIMRYALTNSRSCRLV